MDELEFFLLKEVLPQNSNIVELVKFLDKYQKLHIQIKVVTLKATSYRSMSQVFLEKSEYPRFCGQYKLLFKHTALQPLGSFSHMATCRSSLENSGKLSSQPILNKNSPWIHTESELDVLGVFGKLVKYVVHLSKSNLKNKIQLTGYPNNKQLVFGLKEF
jgi:hypothetical protein